MASREATLYMQVVPSRMSRGTCRVQRKPQTGNISITRLRGKVFSHQIRHHDVVRRKPCQDIEVAERWHQEAREEVPDKRTSPHENEEPPPTDSPPIRDLVFRLVKRGEHCSCHQGSWPDHSRGPDEVAAHHACESIPKDLGRDCEKQLVDNGHFLIVELVLFDYNLDEIRA